MHRTCLVLSLLLWVGGCTSQEMTCAQGDGCAAPGAPPRGTADSCSDGVKNGSETDLDCGGGCAPCADRKQCEKTSDCVSGDCSGRTCVASRPVVPTHVFYGNYRPDAADLPSTVALIDTSTRTLKDAGGNTVPLPPSAGFATERDSAILSIGGWRVTAPVTVTGTRSLVVLAGGAVVIGAPVRGSAVGAVPGPGGGGPDQGPGAGGMTDGGLSGGGGGGGGMGTPGAKGGAWRRATGAGGSYVSYGGTGGVAYAPELIDWAAGSGGSTGGSVTFTGESGPRNCTGGAGGGAIQITSAASITIQAGGLVAVNGGGGAGGGASAGREIPGGGGGSGGMIFLEAPTLTVAGGLFANGGAGGDPANTPSVGQNGPESASPALGATARAGNGGARNVLPTSPPAGDPANGGGGGAAGRIWLRTRGQPAAVSGAVSPEPLTDITL